MHASLGAAHKQWGRPQQRGAGTQDGGPTTSTPPPSKQGAPPSNKGAGAATRGQGCRQWGHPTTTTPQPSIPNRDTPCGITTCTLPLQHASYGHRQSVRAQPPTRCWAPPLPTLLGRREWGEARPRAVHSSTSARPAHTRARRTRDHLTHRHHTLAPQRSSSQTLSARGRTRALSHLPRPPHLGRWPTA